MEKSKGRGFSAGFVQQCQFSDGSFMFLDSRAPPIGRRQSPRAGPVQELSSCTGTAATIDAAALHQSDCRLKLQGSNSPNCSTTQSTYWTRRTATAFPGRDGLPGMRRSS